MSKRVFFLSFFILAFSFLIYAQVPQMINYQGVLSDVSGTAVNGSFSIEFKIYDSATGGTVLWSETQTVIVSDGLFDALLGSVTPIPYSVFDGADKYLALKIGSDSEMTPRKRLVSVGYSLRAYEADKLDGKDAADFVQSGQENSVSTNMLQDNAVTTDKIAPKVLSSLSGVSNDGGNVNLVAGDNVTITPDDENNEITITATAGPGGDNLGDHTATQNLKMNGHWVSKNGDNKGIYVQSGGETWVGHDLINLKFIPSSYNQIMKNLHVMYKEGNGSWAKMTFCKDSLVLYGPVSIQYPLRANLNAIGFKMASGASAGYVLTSDANGAGTWQPISTSGDNLGNHTATQNIKLNGHWLSGDGADKGVFVNADGKVGIGDSDPNDELSVMGDIQANGEIKGLFGVHGIAQGRMYTAVSGYHGGHSKRGGLGAPYYGAYGEDFGTHNLGYLGGDSVAVGGSAPTGWAGYFDGNLFTKGFKMPTGAANSYVLTSDANGVGTWQPVSASGDNLGNHTATQNVKLNGHWLSGDGADEGVFVKNNGNVGIGVSDPGSKLSVDGNIYSEGIIRAKWSLIAEKGYLVVGNSNTSHSNGDILATDDLMADDDVIAKGRVETNGFKMATGASDGHVLTSDANGVGTWQPGGSGDNLGNHTATQNVKLNGHWLSNDGGNEGIYVKTNGNVGIGDSSPSYKLTVDGEADFDGDVYAKNEFIARGSTYPSRTLKMKSVSAQYLIATNDLFINCGTESGTPGTIIFQENGSERMRIKTGGNVGIGTSNPSNILTIKQYSSTDPVADSWTTYSSKRWKTNIKPINNALDLVGRLTGVSYDWKENGKHDIGLIAEDVGEVIPEIVAYEENGVDAKSVDYSRLMAVLIQGMKEQQAKIEKLEKRIIALEKEKH